MGFTNDYKRKLNILIPYYKNKYLKEAKDGKWQQIMFYINKDYKYLCKRKTKYGILELLIQEARVYGQPYCVLF